MDNKQLFPTSRNIQGIFYPLFSVRLCWIESLSLKKRNWVYGLFHISNYISLTTYFQNSVINWMSSLLSPTKNLFAPFLLRTKKSLSGSSSHKPQIPPLWLKLDRAGWIVNCGSDRWASSNFTLTLSWNSVAIVLN